MDTDFPAPGLPAASRLLEQLVQNSSDVIHIADHTGRIRYVNPSVERLLGFSPDALLGRRGTDLVHPEDRKRVIAAMRHALGQAGRQVRLELRLLHCNGGWRTCELAAQTVRDGSDQVLLVGQTRDITETRAGETGLRESEARYRLMIEGSRDVFFYEHDIDHIFTYLSPSVEDVLGYDPDDLLGTPYEDLVADPDSVAAAQEETDRALATGERSSIYEIRVLDRAGTEVVLELVEGPLLQGGRITGIQGFARDITSRKVAETAIRQSERRFRSLIENASDSISVLDAAGVVRYQSPASRRILGYAPEEIVGREGFTTAHPDDQAAVRAAFSDLADGEMEPFEARFRHRDGSWRTLEIRGSNRLDDPAVQGLVINGRDMTEERELELQLRQSQKLEAVGRLAGGVAHDFNNILTAIQGHAEFLLEGGGGSPAAEDIREILDNTRRAADLTRQLLAFARQQVLRPRIVDLGEVVASAEALLRRLIGEDVIISIDRPGEPLPVEADPGQLEQVLINLAVNARDAMPRGGFLAIDLADRVLSAAQASDYPFPIPAGRYLSLTVADTGTGMEPKTVARVFEPFFTTKEQGMGTGLGLSTVYGIVKQSGGYIHVESQPGERTAFEIFLPRSAAAVDVERPRPENEQLRSMDEPRDRTILLVEDEAAVRNVARRVLERGGYTVLDTGSPMDALNRIVPAHPEIDVLLTDVVMPELSGPELAERVAERVAGIRVVYMSGYTGAEIVRRGNLAEDAHLLEKPFSPSELIRMVRDATEGPAG